MDQLGGQVSLFDPASLFGKTCQAPCQAKVEKTSEQSLRKSSKSANQMPLCISVCRMEDGQSRGASTLLMEDGALLGEFSIRSFGEQPNTLTTECGFGELHRGVSASHLSQILEDSVLPKYFLSERACKGILNRAKNRGKELPEQLREALEQQAGVRDCL